MIFKVPVFVSLNFNRRFALVRSRSRFLALFNSPSILVLSVGIAKTVLRGSNIHVFTGPGLTPGLVTVLNLLQLDPGTG